MTVGRRSHWAVAMAAVVPLALVVDAVPARASAWERTTEFAPRFGEAAFDVLILRTLSTAALLAGSVFFVASVPLVAPFEGIRPAWSTFVYAPYEYTVLRELGDF